MQLQTINRSDAEKVFVNVTNIGGATIANSSPAFTFTQANLLASVGSNNNVTGVKVNTTAFIGFIGLADEDIANNSVGRVQVYGYKASAQIAGEGSHALLPAGTGIGPSLAVASVGLFDSGVAQNSTAPVVLLDQVVAATAILDNNTGYANHVFLRCL
jgi:hypothetical protein|tara:strand:- start:286 stop:759 length:474 start_codon:yes stop_codon:yes gene_type:complete